MNKSWTVAIAIASFAVCLISPSQSYAQFTNYPTDYSTYYNFVRDKLFDGQEAIIQTGGGAAPITCTDKPSNPNDLATTVKEIQTKYGINVVGFDSQTHAGDNALTAQKAVQVFQTMCLLFTSEKYQGILNSKANPVNLVFTHNMTVVKDKQRGIACINTPNTCFACTNDDKTTYIQEDASSTCPELQDKFQIVHEFTHIIQNRTRSVLTEFEKAVWLPNKPRIPTWACTKEEAGDGGECEADAVGEFPYYTQYNSSGGTFANYKTGYPNYYDFVENNIFGGEFRGNTFYPLGSTGSNIWFLPSKSAEQFNNGFWQSGVLAQCSQASMAEIFNAYKKPTDNQLTIGDVEKVGQSLGVWDQLQGFHAGGFSPTQKADFEKEANSFGFTVSSHNQYSVNTAGVKTIVDIANSQRPVMISAPGHWLVLWGADSNWQTDPNGQHLWLLDSSGNQYTWAPDKQRAGTPNGKDDPNGTGYQINYKMSLNNFINGTGSGPNQYWTGIAVVFAPRNASGGGGNPPPSANTCGGKYNLNYPKVPASYTLAHQNFGDPTCNYTQNGVYSELKQIDPTNASFWYLTVIPCESGYNPNAVQYPDPFDPSLAWGLFQMGRGKNGTLDHGDVYWQTQAQNAVSYNQNLKGSRHWTYWACARSRWGQ